MQHRIADKLDHFLQPTQYGFRKERGTADAIHYIRRLIEKIGTITRATLLVILDWEKAFDKVRHDKLFDAFERMRRKREARRSRSRRRFNPSRIIGMIAEKTSLHCSSMKNQQRQTMWTSISLVRSSAISMKIVRQVYTLRH